MPHKNVEERKAYWREFYKDPANKEKRRLRNKKYNDSVKGKAKNKETITAYTKTVKGFVMRLYRNMKNRVTGVNKSRTHLYLGKDLLPLEEFYTFAFGSALFYQLFGAYKESGWDRKLAPSIDRIDSSKGYTLDNMEWVTMSENSRRGANSRHGKTSNHK
jgi:hypothetical protein